MNPHTGHLTTDITFITSEYKQVPADLEHAARLKLNGQPEAHVSLTSGGKLSNWARKERNAAKRKRKQELTKASRKKNRGT